jgi:hypothetical protein
MTSVTVNMESETKNTLAEQFIMFLMNELAIAPSKIGVVSSDLSESKCVGMCLDSVEGDNTFLILVDEKDRNLTDTFVTIAHEMVHVKQYMNENLGWFLDNRSDIPYYSRWWEIEAFEKSVEYVKKFAEIIKK